MRAAKLLAILAVSSCLAGCKNKDDTDTVPTIAVPPAVTVPPLPAATAPVPVQPPVVTPPVVAPKPGTQPLPDGGKPPVDAGAPVDAGKPPADAGAAGDKLTGCFNKCQGILQNCLTPTFPADGGFPQPKDPKLCQTAFETCRVACTP
jgi:hypothetical protein